MARQTKYVIVVGDGMADHPVEVLGRRTPLMASKTPHMDWMARHGEMGLVRTVPEGFTPGSEIANLSIMGYDPGRYYSGRGPLEAVSLGLKLQSEDVAFRCNLVTLQGEGDKTVMEDFCAGHITNDEAARIILDLNRELGTSEFQFFPGVGYRHVMVWKEGARRVPNIEKLQLMPPHDIIEKEIHPYMRSLAPGGDGAEILKLMAESRPFLSHHPVNRGRQERGLRPANSIWLWGQGRPPQVMTLRERFGLEGYMISAVHLLKGIGILAGLDPMEVPGATGYFDTNYEGKVVYALKGLETKDFVYLHVEAPDEAGHMGDLRLKMESIEAFDEKVVGGILKGLRDFEDYRVMVLPDHPTPLALRTHTADPVPFVIASSEGRTGRDVAGGFDEESAKGRGIWVPNGHQLIERFIKGPQEGREDR